VRAGAAGVDDALGDAAKALMRAWSIVSQPDTPTSVPIRL